MLDPEDEIFDRKLANHLVSLYYKSSEHEQQELLVGNNSVHLM
jgi:DNA replication licensing factor MCM4